MVTILCAKLRRAHGWLWKEQESKMHVQSDSPKRKRFTGAGRKCIDDQLDDLLLAWIIAQRDKNLRVTVSYIQHKALELVQTDKEFKLSDSDL